MADQTRRFALRDATGPDHRALEGVVGPLTSLDAYRRFIAGLHAGRAPVEAALAKAAWPVAAGTWRPQPIAALLAADMADLGMEKTAEIPVFSLEGGASELFGIAYVLEGSRLGAKVVSREVAKLGLTATHGARHLAEQVGTSADWQRFVGVLEAAEEFDLSAAINAANRVFGFLRHAMSEKASAA